MFREYLYPGIGVLVVVAGAVSGLHALLHKRDPRSQLGWLVVCVFVPGIGMLAYWALGVNRIRTKARKWQELGLFELEEGAQRFSKASTELADVDVSMAEKLAALATISEKVTGRPLLAGNRVQSLRNGEEAYPVMLEAIASAKSYVYLCTYIFDVPGVGEEFIHALGQASERGVEVRVLLDAIGERYSWPPASKLLAGRYPRVAVERFLPFGLSLSGLRVNLRNHRKLLVVDGDVGFTGGMNLGQRHMVEDEKNRKKTADIHFQVHGPAVYALEHVFLEDWWFATSGKAEEPRGYCAMEPVGNAVCRGIKDGPNEDFEALQWILVGAISCARESVAIMTPYFIPSRELVSAMNAAVLRGVRVQIVLPLVNNLPVVGWASQAMLPEVLTFGVEVFYQPPPFNLAKLFIVDDFYVNLGSANLDPRSLRLNFEFNLEVYDRELAAELNGYIGGIIADSERVTQEYISGLGFWPRLRNATAKLFAPYL
jgi:cardiolipin synthase